MLPPRRRPDESFDDYFWRFHRWSDRVADVMTVAVAILLAVVVTEFIGVILGVRLR